MTTRVTVHLMDDIDGTSIRSFLWELDVPPKVTVEEIVQRELNRGSLVFVGNEQRSFIVPVHRISSISVMKD
jgi:hypothetical protein